MKRYLTFYSRFKMYMSKINLRITCCSTCNIFIFLLLVSSCLVLNSWKYFKLLVDSVKMTLWHNKTLTIQNYFLIQKAIFCLITLLFWTKTKRTWNFWRPRAFIFMQGGFFQWAFSATISISLLEFFLILLHCILNFYLLRTNNRIILTNL